MTRRRLSLLLAVASLAASGASAQQPPRFQASVDVTTLDVAVVDGAGKPITDLRPDEFVVRIDGTPRRVASAHWVSLAADDKVASPVAVPPGYSSNENATGGRLVIIGIDQPNIRFGAARGLIAATNAFIDRLLPSDRIAAVGFGPGSQATAFTSDRDLVKRAIARMTGQRQMSLFPEHSIGLWEATQVVRGMPGVLEEIVGRECAGLGRGQLEICIAQVEAEAETMGRDAQEEADQTIRGLRDLLKGLQAVDAPKTLVLVSEGFVMEDQSRVTELGALAAAARTTVYVMKLDDMLYDATNARMPITPFQDRRVRAEGLETLAATARGTLFTVVGTGAALFQRIESEMSGYYLIGIESEPRDRDGKSHPVRVEVARKGALVRARRELLNAAADARARAPREAVVAALATPLLSSALPLRVTTFGLHGPEPSKVQLLIHADVGSDYTSSRQLAVAYVIFDRDGRIVESQVVDARAMPIMNGVPSALQYSGGASLAPGEYTLKLAVAEGDRVGSVQHQFRAAVVDAGAVALSDLIAGGPPERTDFLQPTVSYTISYGTLQGYLEAYGSGLDAVKVRYEIAADDQAPPIATAEVAGRSAGDSRMLFSKALPLPSLPPGKYVLRAVVSTDAAPIKTLTREFEIAPPPVLMTSADGAPTVVPATELFLPVEEAQFAPPFRREDALEPGIVQQFRGMVAPQVKDAFEKGVSQLAAGDVTNAALSFKSGINPDVDSTAQLAYLAVCFALSGRDTDAAGAWQTALIDGADNPQVYAWLGDALLRGRQLGEARTLFDEAAAKWPADARFTKPLALLQATFGSGRDAVRTLERYLSAHADDTDALFLGVEWIYHVHAAGASVRSRAEDLKLARTYAEAYEKAGGPKTALVKQWLDFLQKEK